MISAHTRAIRYRTLTISRPQEILLMQRDLELKVEQRDCLNAEIVRLEMEIELRKAESYGEAYHEKAS